jgi:hypothetical protein
VGNQFRPYGLPRNLSVSSHPPGRVVPVRVFPWRNGAAIGAASGALGGALTDVGIDDKWMKETAAAIQPGTAALFVLVRKMTADKVLEGLKGEGGTVMKTSLDHTKEEALRAALAGAQAASRRLPVSRASQESRERWSDRVLSVSQPRST